MSLSEKIAKIYNELFGEDIVKNETCKLDDGTICDFASFEVGQDVFEVQTDGTKVPLKDGTYKREDGSTFTVVGGKIDTIMESVEEEEVVVETAVVENTVAPEEVKNEEPKIDLSAFEDRLKKIEDFIATLQDNKELSNVVDLIDKMSLKISKIENKVEVLGKQPITNLVKTKPIETKEEEVPSWLKRY